MEVKKHLDLLGHKCVDRVTGLSGVITSVTFDLYGCIQALVSPGIKEGEVKPAESWWLDVTRLDITSDAPVMVQPDFELGYVAEGRKGPADKPAGRF